MDNEKTPFKKQTVHPGDVRKTVRTLLKNERVARIVLRKPGGDIIMVIPVNHYVSYEGRVAMAEPSLAAVASMSDHVKEITVEVVLD